MAISGALQLSLELGFRSSHGSNKRLRNWRTRGDLYLLGTDLSSVSLYSRSTNLAKKRRRRLCTVPSRNHRFGCRCFLNPGPSSDATCVKNVALTLARSLNRLQGSPLVIKFASAVGIVVFAIWGLGPLVQHIRNVFLRKSDSSWKKSSTYHVTTSYVRPLLLWTGAIFICRAVDPMVLPYESGEIVKQRLLNFVRALSTVLALAQCLSSVIQQAQKYFMETNDPADSRNMGFQFAGRALCSAVWVAAISLFMELLGFSTQRWVTAGGLGTVLLTLAGREILTNFLSSIMIHATRPFVPNEWIQTKIQGYEVSGTVEHVGWWSPTIIRGDDREAVHIPNHKFTVNVVRNLSQKTHWRIKTHLAISHLDVAKVNNIVADMRKVLAKNPQVEQQKLHRRVFLDYVNPENQALAIMVSCFVKTSRFEEYLCVKEAILLDLIRVITHHRARLATPIRTVQKIFTESDSENGPFQDSVYDQRAALNRLLLIEPNYKISEDYKTKTQARSPQRANEDEDSNKATPKSTPDNNNNNNNNKTDAKEQDVKQPVTTKPSMEENIVLGVALEGSKRTLPIEEEDVGPTPASNPEDSKELAALRSSNSPSMTEKEKNDNKRSNASGSTGGDQVEQKD